MGTRVYFLIMGTAGFISSTLGASSRELFKGTLEALGAGSKGLEVSDSRRKFLQELRVLGFGFRSRFDESSIWAQGLAVLGLASLGG